MIHKTAVVDAGAELGKDVEIGPFTYIEGDVKIGDGCVIGPHATVLRYTTLGQKCHVHAGAVIGDLPQDLGFEGGRSFVNIGPGCVIREGVTIHRGTKPETATEIGDGCFLMAFSHFAHNVRLGRNVIVANTALLAGYVDVGDKTFISGDVLVHQFVRIGRLAMLGGGCAVSQDVPPFCTVEPMKGNEVMGLNVIGMRRGGLTPAERAEVKKVFTVLYRSGLNHRQALERIKADFSSPLAMEIYEFVVQSKRGICSFSGGKEEDVEI
jgi:UDP-N-acetylglucosamine acyltransferase